VTGVLESLKQDKTWAPITQYGGTVMKIVPKKKRLDYAVVVSDAGELKLAALAALETTQLDDR
jgi:BRCT domain type II-containing protein